jgi:hypothetical protein
MPEQGVVAGGAGLTGVASSREEAEGPADFSVITVNSLSGPQVVNLLNAFANNLFLSFVLDKSK